MGATPASYLQKWKTYTTIKTDPWQVKLLPTIMNKTIPSQDWYEPACRDMVRNGAKLFVYVNEHNLGITSRECENISKTKEFQAVLRAERNKFYKELANDPSRSRATAVGQMLFAVQKLLDGEQYDKAVNALSALFKAEGWTSDSASVNIFQDLNAKDFDAIRRRLGNNSKTLTN